MAPCAIFSLNAETPSVIFYPCVDTPIYLYIYYIGVIALCFNCHSNHSVDRAKYFSRFSI